MRQLMDGRPRDQPEPRQSSTLPDTPQQRSPPRPSTRTASQPTRRSAAERSVAGLDWANVVDHVAIDDSKMVVVSTDVANIDARMVTLGSPPAVVAVMIEKHRVLPWSPTSRDIPALDCRCGALGRQRRVPAPLEGHLERVRYPPFFDGRSPLGIALVEGRSRSWNRCSRRWPWRSQVSDPDQSD